MRGTPLLLLLLLAWSLRADDSWTNCPPACRCHWVSGKKSADCAGAGLSAVPASLSGEMQAVDLSRNHLAVLPADAFLSVGLVNVHRLKLRACGVRSVDKRAFAGLSILTLLDLSHNMIAALHPLVFRETARLTDLHLSANPLSKLEDGLFSNLLYLQTVELSDCRLSQVGLKTFLNVPKLKNLKLGNNNLTALRPAVFEHLGRGLLSLELYGNPWHCNCLLKPFVDWALGRNLYAAPTSCWDPAALRGRAWPQLTAEDLACRPQVAVSAPRVETAPGGEATLGCRSSGSPPPQLHWVFRSRVLAEEPGRYLLRAADAGWLNLTVVGARPDDAGEYLCVAKSPGGVDERAVALRVAETTGVVAAGGGHDPGTLGLVVGLAVGAAVCLLVAGLLLCLCCRRRRAKQGCSEPQSAPANHGALSAADEKFPLTAVNPVQKPPRRVEQSDCTDPECSLLDAGSTYKPSSVTDSDDRLEGRSVDSLYSYRGAPHDGMDAYPPDLLAFGGGQASPAASSASTAPDSSRLPPQSPAQQLPPHLLFGTLPYSRSQSPFSPRHHQGYVTIPRRPRVPSWGSAHDGLGLRLEPVYDNLGPRTTADGSSVLSLNALGSPAESTPLRCPPIEEQPSASPGDWARAPPEGASLRKRPQERPPQKIPPRPPPKPRKLAVEVPPGPLFEDEGEDGTEV
ncbi:leucine-rich repeat-containing protein 24-like [Bacillus rossius redtenbacheri]|uniref:leucine-rich repeat-containing protein 24-like n=1 Tax=Bacillus rossius redtenbacheri TaxID=93214 RepID=UPI002FDE7F44